MLKNKYLSQQIAKKFKNKHRKRFERSTTTQKKWRKYQKNCCEKCQTELCKYGTKKELRRLKKQHLRKCACKMKTNDSYNKHCKRVEFTVGNKKYPISNPFDDFNIFSCYILDYCRISLDNGADMTPTIDYGYCCSISFCQPYEMYTLLDVDSLYDFVEEYNWKCLKQTKNKYLSQKIAKRFKNKHRKNTFHPNTTTQKKRKKYNKNWCKKSQRKFCEKGNKKELKRLKKKHLRKCDCENNKFCNRNKSNNIVSYQSYEYQDLYDGFNDIYEFNESSDESDQEEKCVEMIQDSITSVGTCEKNDISLVCCSKSKFVESECNKISDLEWKSFYPQLPNKICCIGGVVVYDEYTKLRCIEIDDIEINSKIYWYKKIYFLDENKLESDLFNNGDRVIFDVNINCFGNVCDNKWIINIKNVRLAKQNRLISLDNMYLFLVRYLWICSNCYKLFIPKDIQKLILYYYSERMVYFSKYQEAYETEEDVEEFDKKYKEEKPLKAEVINEIDNYILFLSWRKCKIRSKCSLYQHLPYFTSGEHIISHTNQMYNEFNVEITRSEHDQFSGHILFDKNGDFECIKIDDIDINKQLFWGKQIYYVLKQKGDEYLWNKISGGERVLFDIVINCTVHKNTSNLSWSYVAKDYWTIIAANLRLTKQNKSKFTINDIKSMISGYLSMYSHHFNLFLPKDIEQLIGSYYNKHCKSMLKEMKDVQKYFKISNNEPWQHNIFMSRFGLKRNKSYSLQINLVKDSVFFGMEYLKIGILSKPQKVYDLLNKYPNQSKWWLSNETRDCLFYEFNLFSNGEIRYGIRAGNMIKFVISSDNKLILRKKGKIIDRIDKFNSEFTFYPYIAFSPSMANDTAFKIFHLKAEYGDVEFCGYW